MEDIFKIRQEVGRWSRRERRGGEGGEGGREGERGEGSECERESTILAHRTFLLPLGVYSRCL